MIHKRTEGTETKIKLTGIQHHVSKCIYPSGAAVGIHPLFDELRQRSQVQCHPGGFYDQHRAL